MDETWFNDMVIYGILSDTLDDADLGKVVKALSCEDDEDEVDLHDEKLNAIYRMACIIRSMCKC